MLVRIRFLGDMVSWENGQHFKISWKKDGKQMETFSTLLFWYVNYFGAPKEVEIKNFRTQLINGDNLNIVCTINIPGL